METRQVEESRTCNYCHSEHDEDDLIPVVGGEVIGKWDDPEPHFGVAGFHGDPEVQLWCPHRYESVFDTTPPSQVRQQFTRITRWLSAKTVTAFVVGVTLTTLAFLMFM